VLVFQSEGVCPNGVFGKEFIFVNTEMQLEAEVLSLRQLGMPNPNPPIKAVKLNAFFIFKLTHPEGALI